LLRSAMVPSAECGWMGYGATAHLQGNGWLSASVATHHWELSFAQADTAETVAVRAEAKGCHVYGWLWQCEVTEDSFPITLDMTVGFVVQDSRALAHLEESDWLLHLEDIWYELIGKASILQVIPTQHIAKLY
jgi:hypothetical protein